jgi:hypothetical protein
VLCTQNWGGRTAATGVSGLNDAQNCNVVYSLNKWILLLAFVSWVEKEQNLGRCIRWSILTGDPSVCFSQQPRLKARDPKFLCFLPAVLCKTGWGARMSQGFRLINVLAVWPVDVYRTALFAGERLERGVCMCTRETWRRRIASGRSQNFEKRLQLRKVCLFSNSFRKNSSSIKIWQETRIMYMKINMGTFTITCLCLLKWKMFQKNVVEKIKPHILCSIHFFRKWCRLWDMWKILKCFLFFRSKSSYANEPKWFRLYVHSLSC